MKKSLLITLALIAFIIPAFAQDKCTIKLADAPEVRGLKLGMKLAEIKEHFKKVRTYYALDKQANDLGFMEAHIFIIGEAAKDEFVGLDGIEMQFLDNVLTSILIKYDTQVRWSSVDEFVGKIAEAYRLPKQWDDKTYMFIGGRTIQFSKEVDNYKRALTCNGFAVQADLRGGTALQLFDTSVSDVLTKRREAKEQKSKDTFKP
jgi:hypothetical protein